jgi:hypothetical protein
MSPIRHYQNQPAIYAGIGGAPDSDAAASAVQIVTAWLIAIGVIGLLALLS